MAASDASDTERDEEVEESHAGYQEEEEEEEPLLLFQRVVHSDLTALLQTESISCIALCNGVLAVGMRSGTTVLLELSGRLVSAPATFARASVLTPLAASQELQAQGCCERHRLRFHRRIRRHRLGGRAGGGARPALDCGPVPKPHLPASSPRLSR
jgi:hypothetical protein